MAFYRVYTGDTGTFRKALEAAGFPSYRPRSPWGIEQARTIYSDTYPRRTGGKPTTRRLKLSGARDIWNASTYRKKLLERWLREMFGERFIRCGTYADGRGEAYTIHLKAK